MLKRTALLFWLGFVSCVTFADEEAAQPQTPAKLKSEADAKEETAAKPDENTKDTVKKDPCNGVKIVGYVQESYNHLERENRFISGVFDRSFDLKENGTALQQAALTVSYLPDAGLGGLVNVVLGLDAFIIAPYGYNPDIGSNNIGFVPAQVYLNYNQGSFTWMVGNFNSLVGLEATDPTNNTNFSLSNPATFSQPNSVMGVRMTYAMNDKVKLIMGVNNGWDDIRDTSRDKTIELSIAYTPNKKLSLNIDSLSGQQRVVDKTATGPIGTRNIFDIYGTFNVTEKLSLSANFDYGNQNNTTQQIGNPGRAIWIGFAGYVNYKFNDKWRVSLRGDDFSDRDGYRTGVPQNLKEATFTVGYIPVKNLNLCAEVRRDVSNANSFVDKNGTTLGNAQQSFAIAALYLFSNT